MACKKKMLAKQEQSARVYFQEGFSVFVPSLGTLLTHERPCLSFIAVSKASLVGDAYAVKI